MNASKISLRPVVVESPFAGSNSAIVERNKQYLELCMRDCIMNYGDAPFASHKLYTDALDDNVMYERELGIKAGFAWGQFADAYVVYTDLGISKGMEQGIKNAHEYDIPVEMRRLPASLMEGVIINYLK